MKKTNIFRDTKRIKVASDVKAMSLKVSTLIFSIFSDP